VKQASALHECVSDHLMNAVLTGRG
jgi:hypothetical protein